MTKRIVSLIVVLLLTFSCLALPASAAAGSYSSGLDDSASLLSASEQASLTETISEISAKIQGNLGVVTVNDLNGATFSFNGTTQDYADRYYEEKFGMNTDGILILLVLSDEHGKRTVYFSTSGKCIKRLSDSEREDILDDIIDNHTPDSKGYYDFLNAAVVDLGKVVTPNV